MNEMTRALGVVLAVNMQVAGLIAVAFGAEGYLNSHYPLSFSWQLILLPCALLGVVQSYYMMFRYLLRLEKERRKPTQKHHDGR